MSSGASSPRGWLFGPLPDLLLGCGLGYLALFALFAVGGSALREAQPVSLLAVLTLLVSGPHYGGTLLRVYEQRADRRAYALFSGWATLAVALLFVVAVHQPLVGAWMFTLYITWSPWHYTGQNYGLALMLMGRRGVDTSAPAKRLLHISFVCSFLITLMVLHGSSQASGYVPNPVDYGEPSIAFISLGVPPTLARVLLSLATLVHVVSLGAALVLLVRRSGLRKVAPACSIIGLQLLWFSIPFSLSYWGVKTGIDPLDNGIISYYVVWTAMGHATQYLWVTTYYARASASWSGYPRYLTKVLCSGAAIWTLPGIVFAGGHLGTFDSAEGLILLIAAGVNLHHFILDGAIWKLRNSRVASVLIRSVPDAGSDEAGTAHPWLRRAVWAGCGVGALIASATLWVEHSHLPSALRAGDPVRASRALEWIARVGHEKPEQRTTVGNAFQRSGNLDAAALQYQHSLALRPTAAALQGLARIQGRRGDWPGIIETWKRYPTDAAFDPRLAGAAANAYYALDQRDEARALLDTALSHSAGGARDYSRFGDAARTHRDLETAVRYYRKALDLEPGRHVTVNNLAWILATTRNDALRDPAEAMRLTERLIESVDAPDPNHLDTLAAAQAAAGDYPEAIATSLRAIELARGRDAAELVTTLESRLALYRAGQAYREP